MDKPVSQLPPRPLWEQILRGAAFVAGIASVVYIAISFLVGGNDAGPVQVSVHTYEVQEGDWPLLVMAAAFVGFVWLYARIRKR
jgi:hypothetical protein